MPEASGQIDDFIWGVPLMVLIISGGILLTIRTGFIQVVRLPLALKWVFKNEEKDSKKGEVSSFAALMTALSATIGTGNIVGVATAVCAGGPGALFWMIVAAVFGTATKFSEGLLAVKYRDIDENGKTLGGPFYYIEKGMGKQWSWLAKLFAIFGCGVGLFGIGTFSQVNGIVSAVNGFFNPSGASDITIPGIGDYSYITIIASLILAILVALVVVGGLQRISKVASILVPFMAVTYFVFTVLLIILHISEVPAAFVLICKAAFNPKAVTGGIVGSMIVAMQKGVARGIFVSMTGTFIDTIVICNLTGLSIVLTGAWKVEGLEGVQVTSYAFQNGLPFPPALSAFVLMICLIFFAFTTILGWDYYSERCLTYLTHGNKKAVHIFRWLYIAAVFAGPYMTVSAVWTIADIFNGLMAIPNMIAMFALSGVVSREVKDFFANGKHIEA